MLSQGYTFCNSADFVRSALQKKGTLSRAIQKAQAQAAHLRETFFDTPARTSGWAHDFACPVCTTTLTFNADMDYKQGNEFVCPHCGKEGRKDPVQRLTKVKNTFSNFSNLEIYEGSLQDGPKIMTVAFYYQTCMNKVVCTKCGKVKSNTVVTDARVMDSDVTANIELPASAVQGYTLQQVHADGSKTPVQVSYSENGQKAFFQLNMAGGAQLLLLS